MSIFNDRFNLLKEEENLSAVEMAKKLGISPSTLAYYFKDREPKYDILRKIASEFNVTTDWLTGYSDVRSPSRPPKNEIATTAAYNPKASTDFSEDEDEDEEEEYGLLGEELKADVTQKVIDFLLSKYPDDREAFLKEASEFKPLKDDLFPNSDTVYGQSFDDTRLMVMINTAFSKYVSYVVNLSNEAALPVGVFDRDDILDIIEELTLITDTLSELMVNYNYYLAKSVSADKSPNSVRKMISCMFNYNLKQYHKKHPVKQSIDNYNGLFDPDILHYNVHPEEQE